MKIRRLPGFGAALLLVACHGSHGDPGDGEEGSGPRPQQTLLELDLESGISEVPATRGLLGAQGLSFTDLVLALQQAIDDPKPKGMYLRFTDEARDWAQTEELGRLLARFRHDRPIVCYATSLGNASLALAINACDSIWLSPAGSVDNVGIAGQVLYFKGLLDKLQVRADFLHFGRYKSAIESLTDTGPSDPAREAMLSLLGSLRESWLAELKAARPQVDWSHAAEQGPWSSADAKAQGLVDNVGYESDAKDDLKTRVGGGKFRSLFEDSSRDGARELVQTLRFLAGSSESSDRIVVLPMQGAINVEPSGAFSDSGIASAPLSHVVRGLAKDDSVKAVVLRIDSPGGSALASDLLWHELRALGAKKTLVASVGSMAASGGYYIASAAPVIIAEAMSLVGSIGVFGGKITIDETLNQWGVTGVTFPANPDRGAEARAAYASAITPWDEATRERVRAQMGQIYDLFVDRVAAGRSLPREDVLRAAEGRVWTGAQSTRFALIDELGGLTLAIERARTIAELPEGVLVEVESGRRPVIETLLFGESAKDDVFSSQALQVTRPTFAAAAFDRAQPFLATLTPLLRGERVLTALPFALDLN